MRNNTETFIAMGKLAKESPEVLIPNHIDNGIHLRLADCVRDNLMILDALEDEPNDDFKERLVGECLDAAPLLRMYMEAIR